MSTLQKHINRLFQMTINRLNSFLHSLEISLGRLIVMPPFFLYSATLSTLRIRELPKIQQMAFSRATYVDTTKNCIHVLCKNNLALFRSCHSYLHSFVGESSSKYLPKQV